MISLPEYPSKVTKLPDNKWTMIRRLFHKYYLVNGISGQPRKYFMIFSIYLATSSGPVLSASVEFPTSSYFMYYATDKISEIRRSKSSILLLAVSGYRMVSILRCLRDAIEVIKQSIDLQTDDFNTSYTIDTRAKNDVYAYIRSGKQIVKLHITIK